MPRALDPAKLTPTGRRIVAMATRGHPSLNAACAAQGISYRHVLDVIRGRRSPTATTLAKIAAAFGGTIEELYADEVPGRAPKKSRKKSAPSP